MRRPKGKATILILLAFILFLKFSQPSCMKAQPERISVAQLKNLMDGKADVVVVDTRSRTNYDAGHIPGAISMFFPDEIRDRHGELPLDKTIILY